MRKEIEDKLLSFFGGYTTDELGHGEFLSSKNKVISEDVSKIACFTEVKTYKKHSNESD